ncbi:MAG TPA: polysaccharide deacetylase family protein [Candidatus Limnocylindrales bacterium]|nr:polysaccharide deacetylase family protein [Candidatus Limnocylindrales bacterium]
MYTHIRARDPLRPLIAAAMLAGLLLAAPPAPGPVAALLQAPSDPTPAAPAALGITVRFEAGSHTGVKFDAGWRVVASKTAILMRPSSAPQAERRAVPGRGVWYRISAGIWAGYWIRESRLAYVPGFDAQQALNPVVAVPFGAGTYEAYKFDAAGVVVQAKGTRLGRSSMAHADRVATIDGRPYIRIVDGIWAGWWIPGAVTAPEPIRCVAGPPVALSTSRLVRSVPAATGRIALTFDMGGRLDPAVSIMNFLVLERVCATIFPTGAAASTTTGRAVMAIIKAHPELFELGNHTMHHCNLRDGGDGAACPATRPSDAFAIRELTDAEAVIGSLTGRVSKPYWRPPYGAVDTRLVNVAGSAGWKLAVMWSIDTIDWRPISQGGPTAWGIASKIDAKKTAGGIVLMHLGGYSTRDALPAMIALLLEDGYRATTISGLYR